MPLPLAQRASAAVYGRRARPPASGATRFLANLPRLACAALCAAGVPALAQPEPLAVANWGTEQGLPSNIALDIAQTPDGYLWLASYQGLVRFDGVSFRTFTEDDIPGLNRASFRRVAVDGEGRLWAATETDGLVRLARGEWTIFRAADGLKSDKVTALLTDTGGVLWVGTRAGVSRIVGGRVEPLPVPPRGEEPSVTALARDAEGNLWIGTVAEGLLRYRDGVYAEVGAAQGLPDGRITALLAAADGAVWVGSYDAGFVRIRGGRLSRHAVQGRAVPRRVADFHRDADGQWWIAADNGLFRLEGERAVPVRGPGERELTQAAVVYSDRDGNVWVGSRHQGLFRLRPAAVRTVGAAEGLPHALVSAVDGDGSAGAWVATQSGVAHLTPAGVRTFSRETGALSDNVTRDVLRTRSGEVWVATNGGLSRVEGGPPVTLTTAQGLADDRARTLFEGSDGTLWVGTYNGLSAVRAGRVQSYGPEHGLADPYVLSVFQDSRGTLWVGTQSEGLFRWTGGRFVRGPAQLAGQPVFRIWEDERGALWLGGARGLGRIRGDSVSLLTAGQGLPGNAVFQALGDGRGRVWLTGPWGIGHARKEALEAVAAGRSASVDVKTFGSRDGMAAAEASSISRAWLAPDGRLWFPTPAGVAVIDPSTLERNVRPPTTLVERVEIDENGFHVHERIRGGPGARKLEFHFTATSFVAPEQLRFRYRLDGYDRDWVEGGTRRAAYYTNLPPGNYVFRVESRNEDGVRGPEAAVELRLLPYPWQTWWFAAALLLVLAGLVLAAHRLRLRMVQQALREEMLRDLSLQDDLTGLSNRRGLVTRAERHLRGGEAGARAVGVIFVDLDGLKAINDTVGHQQGDQALRDTAAILREVSGGDDVLARLGGDEFAVLVVEPREATGTLEGACARLLEAVERWNAEGDRPYRISLSVGYSALDPARPQALEELLDTADQRMYLHKRRKQFART